MTLCIGLRLLSGGPAAGDVRPLSGTEPLVQGGDPAAEMVQGIGRYLDREMGAAAGRRSARWERDFFAPAADVASGEAHSRRLRRIIGVVEPEEPARLEAIAPEPGAIWLGEGKECRVTPVRWSVLKGLDAEGLLIEPIGKAGADVVALPDCDWTPEMLAGLAPGVPAEGQFARRLAESGCRVLVPLLMDRRDTYSGNASVRMTNQPHREFIYRAAFEMGRHVIGFEVQKVLAAVDWFGQSGGGAPIGVMGYGEGGLLALYAAAVDARISAAAVSGYFGPREQLWREPIYRNVWGLLAEFGDAEIASMVAPRALIIEACPHPEVAGPPAAGRDRRGAAPGMLTTPAFESVEAEFERARRLVGELKPEGQMSMHRSTRHGGSDALSAFLAAMGLSLRDDNSPAGLRGGRLPEAASETRFHRQFDQLVEYTQHLMREGEFRRAAFWAKADPKTPASWEASARWFRDYLWDEIIGRLPPSKEPMRPRSRRVYDEPKFAGYEIVMDVYPDVFAQGLLLIPKDIAPGERRPVVVCQHGLEGRPQDCADPKVAHRAYQKYACALAELGFVTYAPQNPYIGEERFRELQRKANPLGLSIFAFIVRQHERTLEWLAQQPFVDPARIAFYGLSYGGKTAMRVPALLEGYCLSICSGDFNDWIRKNVSARDRYSYLFTGEYEMPEFDLGNTFNYAEMSWLIFPRPFMVERGRHDGVAPDEWVASEFEKTRRRYALLGLGDRAAIEFFNGPHAIHGVGTFEFLHRHLRWPETRP